MGTCNIEIYRLCCILDEINKWTKKWRMVINCQKNKTEIICFNSPEGKPPQSFKLGEDEINTVTSSKVLGVIIDKDLNCEDHSKSVHKNCRYKWISTCKYSNRTGDLIKKYWSELLKQYSFQVYSMQV